MNNNASVSAGWSTMFEACLEPGDLVEIGDGYLIDDVKVAIFMGISQNLLCYELLSDGLIWRSFSDKVRIIRKANDCEG